MPVFVMALCFAAVAVTQPLAVPEDHRDELSSATALSHGETASVELNFGNDKDSFRMDLLNKTIIAISGTGEGQDWATRLLRTNGEFGTCRAIHIHDILPTHRAI